ncbi:hypothetical protein EBX93_16160 [bacterium]|nr:hypothetical protein [bacterium]
MRRVRVNGRVELDVSIELDVEANLTEEEILDLAYNEFGGIASYCGNGGTDKLIGVAGEYESILCESEVEFTFVEELEENEED